MPVRIGTPANIKGLSDIVNNPIYSTGVGLLHFGAQAHRKGVPESGGNSGTGISRIERLVPGWFVTVIETMTSVFN